MKTRLFISYSHKDTDKVVSIVRQLALNGYDIWMDVKDIVPGDNYIYKIFEGVHSSDIYVIFLSNASINSNCVTKELSHAVQRQLENSNFKILPILLEEVNIPKVICDIEYVDATIVTSNVIDDIYNILRFDVNNKSAILRLSSIEFILAKNTTVEFDANCYFEKEDLAEDCTKIVSELRSKAYGILMNFISIDEFDIMSELPHFTNGIYEERITTEPGSMIGSNCKRVSLSTIVFNPDEEKVKLLLKKNNDLLVFESITFGFSVPMKEGESYETVGKRCLTKLRDNYIILEYNVKNGAKIQLEDDFYLSLAISNEQVRITLNSKYDFQLSDKLKEFDVYKFINLLLS